jgi:hypothetical protein
VNVVLAPTAKTANVKITRIGPADLNGPVLISDDSVNVVGGRLSVALTQVLNGTAYSVTVTPTA